MSEWIRVQDRLPLPAKTNESHSDKALVVMWDGRIEVDSIWFWEIKGQKHPRITHWMPLPEPPK